MSATNNKKFRIQNGAAITGELTVNGQIVITEEGKVTVPAITEAVASIVASDIATLQSQVDAILGTSPEHLNSLQEIVAQFQSEDGDIQTLITNNSTAITAMQATLSSGVAGAADFAALNTFVTGSSTNSPIGSGLTEASGSVIPFGWTEGLGTGLLVKHSSASYIKDIPAGNWEFNYYINGSSIFETTMYMFPNSVDFDSGSVESIISANTPLATFSSPEGYSTWSFSTSEIGQFVIVPRLKPQYTHDSGWDGMRLVMDQRGEMGHRDNAGFVPVNHTLETTATQVVPAINELHTEISSLSALQSGDTSGLTAAIATAKSEAQTYADGAVANAIDAAPAALDTLNELAAALGDDANFASTMTSALAGKATTSDLQTLQDSLGISTKLYVQDSAPSTMAENEIWIDSTDGSVHKSGASIPVGSIRREHVISNPGDALRFFGDSNYAGMHAPYGTRGNSPMMHYQGSGIPDSNFMYGQNNGGTIEFSVPLGLSAWESVGGSVYLDYVKYGDGEIVAVWQIGMYTEDFTFTKPVKGLQFRRGYNSNNIPLGIRITGAGVSQWTQVSSVDTDLSPYSTTAEMNSAIATAVANADVDLSGYSTTTEMNSAITAEVASVIDTAPASLDTLNELAAALGDDANFASTITASIATKATAADLTALEAQITGGVATLAQGALADTAVQPADLAALEAKTTGLAYDASSTTIDMESTLDMKNNPIVNVPLPVSDTDVATKAYVDSGVSAVDLSAYSTTVEMDSAIANVTVDLSGYSTTAEMDSAITAEVASVIDAAPASLDTLNELAAALGDDANFASTVTASIATKASAADLTALETQITGGVATLAQGALADTAVQPEDLGALASMDKGTGLTETSTNSYSWSTQTLTDISSDMTTDLQALASFVSSNLYDNGVGYMWNMATNGHSVSGSNYSAISNKDLSVTQIDGNGHFHKTMGIHGIPTVSFGASDYEMSQHHKGAVMLFNSDGQMIDVLWNDINELSNFGRAVTMNAAGTKMVVFSYLRTSSNTQVRLYDLAPTGATLTGTWNSGGSSDASDGNIAISDNHIFIGNPYIGGGEVKVFDYSGNLIRTLSDGGGSGNYLGSQVFYESDMIVSLASQGGQYPNISPYIQVWNSDGSSLLYTHTLPGGGSAESMVGFATNGAAVHDGHIYLVRKPMSGYGDYWNKLLKINLITGVITEINSQNRTKRTDWGIRLLIDTVSGTIGVYEANSDNLGQWDLPSYVRRGTGIHFYDTSDLSFLGTSEGDSSNTLSANQGGTYDYYASNYFNNAVMTNSGIVVIDDLYGAGNTDGFVVHKLASELQASITLDVDTSVIATQSYVDSAVSSADVDLSGYSTTVEMDTAIANVTVDLSGYSTTTEMNSAITAEVANVIDTAPASLDTLNELAAALGDDANFASTVTASIATKASQTDLDANTTAIATKASQTDLDTNTAAIAAETARAQAAEADLVSHLGGDIASGDLTITGTANFNGGLSFGDGNGSIGFNSGVDDIQVLSNMDMQGNKLLGVGAPVDSVDVTTKGYVDGEISTSLSTAAADATAKADAAQTAAITAAGTAATAAIAATIDAAPASLDTLNELAAALGDDANFASTVTASLATKSDSTATTAAISAETTAREGADSDLQSAIDALSGLQSGDTSSLTSQIATAKSQAISTASADATVKSDAAQAAASADATAKSDAAQSQAISTASDTATALANAAQAQAIATASTDATAKADQAEVDAKAYADQVVASTIDAAPAALDTLNELAAALGDDANFASTVTASLATKADDAATTAALATKEDKTVVAALDTFVKGGEVEEGFVSGVPDIGNPSLSTGDFDFSNGTVSSGNIGVKVDRSGGLDVPAFAVTLEVGKTYAISYTGGGYTDQNGNFMPMSYMAAIPASIHPSGGHDFSSAQSNNQMFSVDDDNVVVDSSYEARIVWGMVSAQGITGPGQSITSTTGYLTPTVADWHLVFWAQAISQMDVESISIKEYTFGGGSIPLDTTATQVIPAINELHTEIGAIVSTQSGDVSTLTSDIAAETSARQSAITAETSARESAITSAISTASADATVKADQAEADAKAYADQVVASTVDAAPAALDTLNELAAALGDDANFASTVTSSIATKADDVATTAALATKADDAATTVALATKADDVATTTALATKADASSVSSIENFLNYQNGATQTSTISDQPESAYNLTKGSHRSWGSSFGEAIKVSNDFVFVGAPDSNVSVGALWVYPKSDMSNPVRIDFPGLSTWHTNHMPKFGEIFEFSESSKILAVGTSSGSPWNDPNYGSTYINTGAVWFFDLTNISNVTLIHSYIPQISNSNVGSSISYDNGKWFAGHASGINHVSVFDENSLTSSPSVINQPTVFTTSSGHFGRAVHAGNGYLYVPDREAKNANGDQQGAMHIYDTSTLSRVTSFLFEGADHSTAGAVVYRSGFVSDKFVYSVGLTIHVTEIGTSNHISSTLADSTGANLEQVMTSSHFWYRDTSGSMNAYTLSDLTTPAYQIPSFQGNTIGVDSVTNEVYLGQVKTGGDPYHSSQVGVLEVSSGFTLKSDLETLITANTSAISTETSARTSADTTLQSNIDTEVARATAAEGVNAVAISTETSARTSAITAETSARESAVTSAISTASADATAKADAAEADAKAYADQVVAATVDAAPAALDTLNELAAALGDDANFSATVTTSIGTKANQTSLDAETSARSTADSGLQSNIDGEETARIAGDASLQSAIDAEIVARTTADTTETSARIAGDSDLQSAIDSLTSTQSSDQVSLQSQITAEVARAASAEVVNAANIVSETSARSSADAAIESDIIGLQNQVGAIISGSPASLDTLVEIVSAFENADSDLSGVITNNSGRLTTAETNITALDADITAEENARGAGDVALGLRIDSDRTASIASFSSETASRVSGDASLQSAISTEETARIAGDASLQSAIDALSASSTSSALLETSERTSAVSTETAARIAGDSVLQSAIDAEISRATGAESGLQTQISNILSNTDATALNSLAEIVTEFQNADSTLTGVVGSHGTRLTSLESGVSAIESWTTDNLSEGTNKFWTPERTKSVLTGGLCITYNSSTGTISIDETEAASALHVASSGDANALGNESPSHYRIDVYDVNGTIVN